MSEPKFSYQQGYVPKVLVSIYVEPLYLINNIILTLFRITNSSSAVEKINY